jgi:hypothetical protein
MHLPLLNSYGLPARYLVYGLAIVVLGALVVLSGLGAHAPANADVPVPPQTISYNIPFGTSGQSMWGQGTSAAPAPIRQMDVAGVSWNESAAANGIETFAGESFGGSVAAGTDGFLSLNSQFQNAGAGSVDVNYPVQVNLSVPGSDGFRAGQNIAIGSNFIPQAGASLDTTAPTGSLALNAGFNFHGFANAEICFFDCSSINFFDISFGFSQDLARHDSTDLTIFDETIPQGRIVPGAISFITGVSGTFGPPQIHTTFTLGPDGKTLVASGSHDNFMDLDINLTKFIKKLPGGQILGVAVPPVIPGVSAQAHTFDADIFLRMSQSQTLQFAPVIQARLTFPVILNFTVKNPAGAVVASGASPSSPSTSATPWRLSSPKILPTAPFSAPSPPSSPSRTPSPTTSPPP